MTGKSTRKHITQPEFSAKAKGLSDFSIFVNLRSSIYAIIGLKLYLYLINQKFVNLIAIMYQLKIHFVHLNIKCPYRHG